jgi:hypothetical protein
VLLFHQGLDWMDCANSIFVVAIYFYTLRPRPRDGRSTDDDSHSGSQLSAFQRFDDFFLAYHHRCEQGAQTNYICNGTCLPSRVLSVCKQKLSSSDVTQVYCRLTIKPGNPMLTPRVVDVLVSPQGET